MTMNSIKSNKRFLLITLAAFASIAVGILLIESLPDWTLVAEQATNPSTTPIDTASFVPPPQSIAELVGKANVIVIGTVGPIVNQGTFAGYDAGGNVIPSKSTSHPDLPITDFQINIEKVLQDDGTIRAGKPLILRMLGHPINRAERDADRSSYFPMSYTGDRHIFFLSKNPDGTYGLYYGPWSRLVIDGQVVAISDGARTPVQFAGRSFKPTEFIGSLTQSIR